MATTMQRDVFIASHDMDQAQGLLVDDGPGWHDKWSVYDNSIDESIVHISKVDRHRIYICVRQILFQKEEIGASNDPYTASSSEFTALSFCSTLKIHHKLWDEQYSQSSHGVVSRVVLDIFYPVAVPVHHSHSQFHEFREDEQGVGDDHTAILIIYSLDLLHSRPWDVVHQIYRNPKLTIPFSGITVCVSFSTYIHPCPQLASMNSNAYLLFSSTSYS
jgi:hypothetical protein